MTYLHMLYKKEVTVELWQSFLGQAVHDKFQNGQSTR